MKSEKRLGTVYTAAAFFSWGILPLYWKALRRLGSSEVLAHRILWSCLFLIVILSIQKRRGDVRKILIEPKARWVCILTAVLIAVNWMTYIWAINANHIVEASLGYFINPLLNVLLGVVFLKERLNKWQVLAFSLAFCGVAYLMIDFGKLPWISLSLALTFGFYGLLRKIAHVEPLAGLTVETALLSPFCLLYILVLGSRGEGALGSAGIVTHLLLVGAGVVTATPLLWFIHGVRRIPLHTVGFLQYLAPTLQFTIGVLIYQEHFTRTHLISFSFIWTALILFALSNALMGKRNKIPVVT